MKHAFKSGQSYEYKAIREIEKNYKYTFHSAGSHGIADVVACNPAGYGGDWRCNLFQIKSCPQEDVNQVKKAKIADVKLWIWVKRRGWIKLD